MTGDRCCSVNVMRGAGVEPQLTAEQDFQLKAAIHFAMDDDQPVKVARDLYATLAPLIIEWLEAARGVNAGGDPRP